MQANQSTQFQFENEPIEPMSLADKIRSLKEKGGPRDPAKDRRTNRVLLLIGVVISIHVMLHLNRTYSTPSANNLSASQYDDYIRSVDSDYRSEEVAATVLTYFGVIPSWAINLVYGGYILIGLVILGRSSFGSSKKSPK